MRLREERPSMDPGMCFLCEKADDCRYVDTLKNFEPMFFTPLIGRGVAQWTLVPLGLVSVLAVAWIALRRTLSTSRHSRAAFAR